MGEKSVEDYVEQTFPIQCKGRDEQGREALAVPVNVDINIYKRPGSSVIVSDVSNCQYNTGSHGERCKASHPGQDKVGKGVICPYAIYISPTI